MPWDPYRYNHFKKERSDPFEDLFRLVKVRPVMRVIDLGCGTGELTRELADRLPDSRVTGIDSSPEMLERAELLRRPGLDFVQGDLAQVSGEWDLVFSNAAIQWVSDHERLIPRLFNLVAPGGQLVVQLPSNHNHPSHQLIRQIASEEPFCTALGGWQRRSPVLSIEQYADLLYRSGGEDLQVFEKIYPHILAGADAIADWTSGTALVPYFERLSPEMREQFMERYRQALRQLWPAGPVLYAFRRTFFAAVRPQRLTAVG